VAALSCADPQILERRASSWDQRVSRAGPEHLAPLAAGLLHIRPQPERALDIGTGLGDGALLIAREFPQARVRGIDLSEEMVRGAQARIGLDPEGRVAFKVGDASDLPYQEESFDLVAQLNMPPFFAEIGRVLRPGGFAVVASSRALTPPIPPAVLRRASARPASRRSRAAKPPRGPISSPAGGHRVR
jgi:ubiquinone/menaquinone biosynthesis C-methylase UbiE